MKKKYINNVIILLITTAIINTGCSKLIDSTTLLEGLATKQDLIAKLDSVVPGHSHTYGEANSIDSCGDINVWDTSKITDMSFLFNNKHSFNCDISNWDVSNVEDMSNMFVGARAFNQYIGHWDVANVEDMSNMFVGARAFNQDMGHWDIGNEKEMFGIFIGATKQDLIAKLNSVVPGHSHTYGEANPFDSCGDINLWDTSQITDMSSLFENFRLFNCDISHWDVSNVTNMQSMFFVAETFNQDISYWDVGQVTNMGSMFMQAVVFNQDISSWDVSNVKNMNSMFSTYTDDDKSNFNNGGVDLDWGDKTGQVTDMSFMFSDARAFNQDISSWDVGQVTNMEGMFWNASAFNNGDVALDWADTSSVTNMSNMFLGAEAFNQDFSNGSEN